MRREQQTGPSGDPECVCERLGRCPPLVVGQTEADDATVGEADGQPGQRPRFELDAGPVGRDDHANAHAVRPGGGGDRVEDELGERGQSAERRRVPGRVDLDLEPPGPLGRFVGDRFVEQPADVGRPAEHAPGDVVEPLKPEPAPLVGLREHRRPLLAQAARKAHAGPVGELDESRMPHRTGEMQVQVRLRQGQQRATAGDGGHVAILLAGPRARPSDPPRPASARFDSGSADA